MARRWIDGDRLTTGELTGRYHLPREEVDSFQGCIRIYPYEAEIIREGERDRTLFVLREGKLGIFKGVVGAAPTRLGSIEALNIFGEMALLNNEPRNATVIVESDQAVVYAIDRPNLNVILSHPRWSELLINRLSRNLAETNRQLAEVMHTNEQLRQELRGAQKQDNRLLERVQRVLGVVAALQRLIQERAMVGSRGWAYLRSLSRLTENLVRRELPEAAPGLSEVDQALLRETLQEMRLSGEQFPAEDIQ